MKTHTEQTIHVPPQQPISDRLMDVGTFILVVTMLWLTIFFYERNKAKKK